MRNKMKVIIKYIPAEGWKFTDVKTGRSDTVREIGVYLTNEQRDMFFHGQKTFELSGWNSKKFNNELPTRQIHMTGIKEK
tara:strand:+ start:37 stop:276 length:240 start_codon:yes stop_codon:yes gene_type:complete